MYGDHFRSPGRDDRQDGAAPRPAPWETGPAPAPAHDDVKVAGAPGYTPPGQESAFYDAGVYETTEVHDQDDVGVFNVGTPGDGNATAAYGTAAYDMGAPYGEEPAYGHGAPPPYEANATTAMPPFAGPDGGAPDAMAPDFEAMRRTPRSGNKRLIRFAAVAAAVAVAGGGGVAWAVTGGSSGGKAP